MVDISVVLPVYNTPAEYLEKCILSLINQTKKEIEIILVNDGSTNDALDICNQYQLLDSRIIVIDQVNQGVSVARNNGLEKSIGQWVAFVDPDDWLEPEYLESLWLAKNSTTDIVIGNCYINEPNNQVENNFLPYESSQVCTNKKMIMGQLISKTIGGYYPEFMAAGVPWCKLFRKNFIERHRLRYIPGMIRMQDNVFCLNAFYYADEIVFTPTRFYHYRKENSSVSFKFNPKIIKHFNFYFQETESFINLNLQDDIDYKNAFYVKRITSFNSYLKYYIFHPENDNSFKSKKETLREMLGSKEHKEALAGIKYSYCTKQEKLFVFLLKHKLFLPIKIIYSLI